MSEMLKKLDEYLNSPEGKLEMEKMRKKNVLIEEIRQARFIKLENYLKDRSFDAVLSSLFDEHSDAYRDAMYAKGIEPHPNNKLSLLLDYINDTMSDISVAKIENELHFNTSIRFFKGYYFVTMYGQGCAHLFYNSKQERIFTI
jgi:hypothetical protein